MALWGVPILALLILAYHFRWTFDDGFIYFRVVDQVLAGNGPVFNAGERVEAFTSPLWLAVLLVGDVVSPLRLEYTASVLSTCCTVLGVTLATLASARLSRRDQATGIRIPLGLAVLVALWPTWVWATSGMEVGLTYLWIGSCFLVLSSWATQSSRARTEPSWTSVALLGLGGLVRPELILASILFVGLVVSMSTANRRRRWRLVLAAAALPVLYQIFRMGYYGAMVATPAIAKEGFSLRTGHGWMYLRDFIDPYLLAIPVLALVLAVGGPMVRNLLARNEHRVLAVIGVVSGSGLLMAIYVVLVGGDYVHARLFMPALFTFLAPWFVVAATTRYLEGIAVTLAWAVLCGLALRPSAAAEFNTDGDRVVDVWQFTVGYHGRNLTTEDRGFVQRGLDQPWIDGGGLYVGSTFAADGGATGIALIQSDDVVVATRAIGAMGYALGPDARIIDLHGLADPLTAHQMLAFRSLPGHEKLAAAAWLVARYALEPSVVAPDQLTISNGPWPDPSPLEFLEQVAWALAALQCAPIERLLHASTEPFAAGTFVANLWRSFPNTTVRLSRDPRDAFEEHCGEGVPPEVTTFRGGATLVAQLPLGSIPGQIMVIDECTSVYLGTTGDGSEWQAIDGATLGANIQFSLTDPEPRLAAVWHIGPIFTSNAWAWAETDGGGSYRVRLDVDWFPPMLQQWTPIPDDGQVHVALAPDIVAGRWLLLVEGAEIADLPMSYADRGVTGATVPKVAGPSATAGTISIEHAPVEASPTCHALLDHVAEQS